MKNEIIASWKLVTVDGKEQYIVTTMSGATVWAPKSQFDTNAEIICYESKKAGDKYVKKDKTEGILQKDGNNFLGCGKQIVKKHSTMEIMDHLISKGITPTFSMS